MATTPGPSGPDLWYIDDLGAGSAGNPMLRTGRKLTAQGQTANTTAAAVANQAAGAVGIGALAAAATTTVTITNALLTANSYVFCQVARGTTTAQAGAVATVLCAPRVPTAGSCVVDVTNLGSAATLATDYLLWFWILN